MATSDPAGDPRIESRRTLIAGLGQRISCSVLQDPLSRRVLANSSWVFTSTVVDRVLRFVQVIILARMLGVEQFGIFALIQTYSSTVNQFVDSRVYEAVIKFVTRFLHEKEERMATAFVKLSYLIDTITGVTAYLLLLATAGIAERVILKQPATAGLIRLYALTIIVAVPAGTSDALLRVFNRFDWAAYQNVAVGLLRLAGIVLVMLAGGGLRGIIYVYVLSGLAMAGSEVFLTWRASRGVLCVRWRDAHIRDLRSEKRAVTHFLLSTNGNALCKLLERNMDILLIGYFMTPVAVAYYRVARMFTDMMLIHVTPLEQAVYPEFVRLWHEKSVTELRRLFWRVTLISGALGAFGLVGFLALGRWMIKLSLGEKFLPALPALRVLAMGGAIAVIVTFAYQLLLAVGKAPVSLLAIGVGVAVQLPLLFVLIPKFGIVGAAISYLGFLMAWIAVVFPSIRPVLLPRAIPE